MNGSRDLQAWEKEKNGWEGRKEWNEGERCLGGGGGRGFAMRVGREGMFGEEIRKEKEKKEKKKREKKKKEKGKSKREGIFFFKLGYSFLSSWSW